MPKIDRDAFEKISKHVNEHYGIHLTDAKQNLVENRLMKRLKYLKVESFKEYADVLFSKAGNEERTLLCDYLSTNKTYFYREPTHFEFLQKVISESKSNQSYSLWSAACSGGDEVYTLASILQENAKKKGFKYSILGTDISSRMINEAIEGKYSFERISQLPENLIDSYFDKVRANTAIEYKASNILRQSVRFQKFNLIKDIPGLSAKFDFIFCRNVLIYFKEETKLQVVNEMIKKLKPGGYLILGHCEGMLCRHTELKQIQPAVFQMSL
jgi:chemotaxis protein methyltransferase CheR